MSCKVVLSPQFKKEAKRLAKKYVSLKAELEQLFDALEDNPVMGVPLGYNVFKIRLSIASKGRGKSGGARVITYTRIDDAMVLLLSIYDKGEKESVSDKEIEEMLANAIE
jgi:mRNA-degrading endonuclease RelE of RelBE toxin-antitoxin system